MQRLTKREFMSKVINDLYNKQRKKKNDLSGADAHIIENTQRISEYRRKHKP